MTNLKNAAKIGNPKLKMNKWQPVILSKDISSIVISSTEDNVRKCDVWYI
jgi:hypothetical protein